MMRMFGCFFAASQFGSAHTGFPFKRCVCGMRSAPRVGEDSTSTTRMPASACSIAAATPAGSPPKMITCLSDTCVLRAVGPPAKISTLREAGGRKTYQGGGPPAKFATQTSGGGFRRPFQSLIPWRGAVYAGQSRQAAPLQGQDVLESVGRGYLEPLGDFSD